MKSPIQTAYIMYDPGFSNLLPWLKRAILHLRSSSVFWMFEHNHFTEKDLFVYLSSFLEKAISPLQAFEDERMGRGARGSPPAPTSSRTDSRL
jgi:hypothetical protein